MTSMRGVRPDPTILAPGEEIVAHEVDPDAAGEPPVPPRRGYRRRAALRAAGLLGAAVALYLVRREVGLEGFVSLVVALAVVAALLTSVAAAGRAVWGPRWDAALWLSAAWLVLLSVAAATADLLPITDPLAPDFANLRQRPQLESVEPLGTDSLGRSLLSRVVFGARITLGVAVSAVTVGAAIGGAVGLLAGYAKGFFDRVTSMVGDVMLSFPPLILLMGLVTVLPRTGTTIALGLGVLTVPAFFRVTRANAMVLAQREFVTAARAMGARRVRVLTRELLPNVATPVLAYVFVLMAIVIVAEGSLSFLGVGVDPPTPTWGRMIADGQPSFDSAPHLVFIPSLVMFATLFALNTVGERLRASEAPVL